MNDAWILGSPHSSLCQLSGSGFKDIDATVDHHMPASVKIQLVRCSTGLLRHIHLTSPLR